MPTARVTIDIEVPKDHKKIFCEEHVGNYVWNVLRGVAKRDETLTILRVDAQEVL